MCEKNLQLKITVYDIGEIMKHVLKQNVTLPYMKQCSAIIASQAPNFMSQFLSTLEGRKSVVGYSLLPGNSISHVR